MATQQHELRLRRGRNGQITQVVWFHLKHQRFQPRWIVGSLLLWLLLLPVEASCCSSLGRGCWGCGGGCSIRSRGNRVSYSTSQKWNVGGHQPRSCWRWWTAVRPCLTAVVKVCIWYIWGHDKTINIEHNGTPNTFCISCIKPTRANSHNTLEKQRLLSSLLFNNLNMYWNIIYLIQS